MGSGPELVRFDMKLSATCHLNLFDEEAPTIACSSGRGSNAPSSGEDVHDDVELCYMDEDCFDDMWIIRCDSMHFKFAFCNDFFSLTYEHWTLNYEYDSMLP